jgi:protein-S-isoprenylcysteine O-methyltransferase Ste14
VGLALFMGSITPWLIIILFATVIKKIYIKAEEAKLEQKFTSLWQIYKQKVPRWI